MAYDKAAFKSEICCRSSGESLTTTLLDDPALVGVEGEDGDPPASYTYLYFN